MIGAVLDCKLSHIPRAPRCTHTHTHPHTHTHSAGSFLSGPQMYPFEGRKGKERRRANREQIAETTAFHCSDREREINGENELDSETERKGSERNREILPPNCRNVLAFTDNFCLLLEKEREDWCVWQRPPLNQTHELQRGETTAGKPWIWFWRYRCQFSYLVFHYWSFCASCSNRTFTHFSGVW